MKTYEDLCMSVRDIGESFGLECEVCPMKNYSFKNNWRNDSKIKGIKIIFINYSSLSLSKLSPRKYSYFLLPCDWNRFQKNDDYYNDFINFLTTRIKENIIN